MALNKAWIGNPLLERLTLPGGDTNLAGDFSTVPGLALWTAPYDCFIVHMSVLVRDVGPGLVSDGFGCRATPLDPGFAFYIRLKSGAAAEALPGNVITSNLDFLRWSEDIKEVNWGIGLQERGFAAHYEPYGAWGLPFYLTQGQGVATILEEDLSFLTELGIYLVVSKVRQPRPES